jgi:hypothetical protein
MTTAALTLPNDEDTQRVPRPPAADEQPMTRRLSEMDLDPPSGPVPAEVLAYFEAAVEREGLRADR